MSHLRVTLAGAVSLRRDAVVVADRAFSARQLQLVTAMIVVERRDPIAVETLAGALWPSDPPNQWRVAVSGLVGTLRRRLGEVGVEPEAVRGEPGRYVVDLPDLLVDVEEAESAVSKAAEALGAGEATVARDHANQARSILSRPVLPGVTSPWVDALRDRLETHHLESLVLLGRARTALDDHAQARRVLAQARDVDPLREDTWRAVMAAEAAAGNTAGALQAYEDCRHHLAEELGVDPSSETQRLHVELLAAIPDGASLPAPLDPTVGESPPSDDSDPLDVPYVGLRAFQRDDAPLFFGRDAEVQAVIDALAARGIIAVVGPSGVGKSSLVRAGLLPALARGAIAESDTWPTVVMNPGSSPVKTLATELADLAPDIDPAHVDRALRPADGLHHVADVVLGAHGGERLLLVVDQFEEVCTLAGPDEAAHFVALLVGATGRLDGRLAIAVTIRADYYDRVAALAGFEQVLSRSQYVVPALGGEQFEVVITGPARRAGATLEPGLLGQLLTEVAAEPGALPLLQHLLYELWEHRVDRVMTRHAHDELGGVAGALANRAEAVLAGMEATDREAARRVLLRTVQPGDDAGDTRRPVRADELVAPGDDAERVDRVVGRLVDARLLTVSRDGDTHDRVVELAHEALIEHWPRLRSWVDDVRSHLQEHRRLTAAAQEWEREDRHDDWLLAGRPLDDAVALRTAVDRGDVDLGLSAVEQDLLAASMAARDHRIAQEAARAAQERTLERRSTLRLRALVAFVTVVALAAGAFWYSADQRAAVAGVNELVAESIGVVDADPELGLLLALEAHERWERGPAMSSEGVQAALHRGIESQRLLRHFPDAGKLIALDPAGEVFVTARPTSITIPAPVVDLHDARTGAVLHTLEMTGELEPTAAFSPDGTTLITGSYADFLQEWDVATGRELRRIDGPPGYHLSVAEFDPTGTFFAGSHTQFPAYGSGATVVWDATSGEIVADITRLDPPDDFEGVGTLGPVGASFSPDGSEMAIVPFDDPATTQVLDVTTWEESWSVPGPADGVVVSAAWSPDGKWLALGGLQIRIVDTATGEVLRDLSPPDGYADLHGLAWSPDSRHLYSGSGSIHVWDPFEDQPEPLVLRGGHQGRHNNVHLAPGGDVLFTGSHNSDGVRAWDVSDAAGAEVAWLPNRESVLAWSPDGSRLAVDRDDGVVGMWDTSTWSERTMPVNDGVNVAGIEWHPDGRTFVVGSENVAAFDADTGATEWEFEFDVDHLGWAAIDHHPDGTHVAVTTTTNDDLYSVAVLDDAGEQVARLGHDLRVFVNGVAFSPDGSHLAVTRWGGILPLFPRDLGIDIWDWEAGELLQSLDTDAFDVAWHPDGDRVVTGDLSGTPEVWDLAAGEVVMHLRGHDDAASNVDWSADGTRIATGSDDGTVRVWDATTGEELQRFDFDKEGTIQPAFSPDGHHLAAAQWPGGGVRVWTDDLDQLVEIAESRVIRTMTDTECNEYLDRDGCS